MNPYWISLLAAVLILQAMADGILAEIRYANLNGGGQ